MRGLDSTMANLKVREVAERLDVSHKTVYAWLRGGVIPGIKIGNMWRVSEESIDEMLAAITPVAGTGSGRKYSTGSRGGSRSVGDSRSGAAISTVASGVSGSGDVDSAGSGGASGAVAAADPDSGTVAGGVSGFGAAVSAVAGGESDSGAVGTADPDSGDAVAVLEPDDAPEADPFAGLGEIEAGRRTRNDGRINVAIIGVGNCASSLIQGIHKYSEVDASSMQVPGLMHNVLGGYGIGDVNVVAAFDVDAKKVGRDVSEAIFADTNNALRFHDVPSLGVTVDRGMTHDGIGEFLSDVVEKAPGETADIVNILRDREVDVVINYLPVGSEQATKWYVEQVLAAGCAFVNCIPVFIANQPYWQKRFADKGLPVVGDDIKSQVGATIIHRALARLFEDRGVRLDRTYQLNFGGNTDFYNMLERARLVSKKISKTQSVQSQLEKDLPTDDVHISPSDHVAWLEDRKWAYIRLEGTSWGDVPLNVELKLEVEDSPNSAGVAIDAIRCAKIALDRGVEGAVEPASAYFMKSPPTQMRDDDARRLVESFADGV